MNETTPEPLPQDVDLLAGPLALEPGLPGPSDLPGLREANEVPADTVADAPGLAARLTGSADLHAASASMIEAGAPPVNIAAAVERTEVYTRHVADLLVAVHDVVTTRQPGALVQLALANTRLARLEQGDA